MKASRVEPVVMTAARPLVEVITPLSRPRRFHNVKASRVEPVVMTAARPLVEDTGAGRPDAPRLTLDAILPPAKRVKARMPQVGTEGGGGNRRASFANIYLQKGI